MVGLKVHSNLKTAAKKVSFKLRICPGHLVMDILKSSQLVIFSHSTIFITFSYRSLAAFFSSNSYEVRGGENQKWRWIFAFERCVGLIDLSLALSTYLRLGLFLFGGLVTRRVHAKDNHNLEINQFFRKCTNSKML